MKFKKPLTLIIWFFVAISLVYLLKYVNYKDLAEKLRRKFITQKNFVNREVISEESSVIGVVEKVSPAVVSIIVKTSSFDYFTGPVDQESGIGTGFIVDPNGIIVTNSHVVDSVEGEYSVVLKDGTSYNVDKIHLDTYSDLAILEISARNLPTVELGDSSKLKVGQTAVAIGNALGQYQNTVTVGVVSGISRQLTAYSGFGESKTYEGAIQTDAAINPGNSGGPLLNLSGDVIGINVATSVGAENISFAIPVNDLIPLLEGFFKEGKIVKPYMGVSYTVITPEMSKLRDLPEGAYVSNVIENSPAEEAGFKRGDIITKVNDQAVTSESPLSKIISRKKVGDRVKIEFDREGEKKIVTITLNELKQN